MTVTALATLLASANAQSAPSVPDTIEGRVEGHLAACAQAQRLKVMAEPARGG